MVEVSPSSQLYQVRTPALQEFWYNLKEVGTVVSMFITEERSPRDRRINESLSRSAILLLCSHLENFLESLIRDVLKFHESSATLSSELPPSLKVKQILPSSDSLAVTYSGNKWKMIKKVYDHPLSDDRTKCTTNIFDFDAQVRGFASPSPENIESLFSDIGLQDVWAIIFKQVGSDKVKRNLGAFINRRNNIAHGSSADRPTPSDIRRMVVDICQLVRCFNLAIVEYLVKEFVPHNLWGYLLSR